ncbi:hypothetical protein AB0395_04525 [Streptosporangium sp. NPDC051023]|uniref:hypothetical protein n=1 Tax=Streptosporangium sp. NPDC051023 TaxID=3155410 RepID=UPI00344B9184
MSCAGRCSEKKSSFPRRRSIVLAGLALAGAGNTLGLGEWWGGTKLVRRFPILK